MFSLRRLVAGAASRPSTTNLTSSTIHSSGSEPRYCAWRLVDRIAPIVEGLRAQRGRADVDRETGHGF